MGHLQGSADARDRSAHAITAIPAYDPVMGRTVRLSSDGVGRDLLRAREKVTAATARCASTLAISSSARIFAGNEGNQLQAAMSQLTVRNVSAEIVRSLKQRAAAHGRSAEAEHREILREALPEGADNSRRGRKFCGNARFPVDTTEVIPANRDHDGAA